MRKNQAPLFLLACLSLLALGGHLSHPVLAQSSTDSPIYGLVPLVGFNSSVSAIQDTGANISWRTNARANSTVEYGTTTGYGALRTDPAMVINHTISLDGLSPGTTYHYRLISVDAAGHVYRSGDLQFTTTGVAPTPAPWVPGGGGGGSWSPEHLILPMDCRYSGSGVITPVTRGGILTSCTIVSSMNGMTDLRSSWSVMVTREPPSDASFITHILARPPDSTLTAFDTALWSSGLRMTAIAYVMQVEGTGPVATGDVTIQMDVTRSWVSLNGGVDAVRVLRQGDDGLVQILGTRFSNYVPDTGHMNYRATSPDDLALYALVAVEAVPAMVPPTPVTAVTTAGLQGIVTEPAGFPAPGATGPLAILVIPAIIIMAFILILFMRKRGG
jgi:Purple acid Phosphatase, N-terminal domain